MIANSEARGRLPRTLARLTIAVGLAATAGIILTATAVPVRLVGVTREGDTILIEATEPVAYSVRRPDALSLVVDMRNVSVSDARADIAGEGAITGVRLEQASAEDGRALARVHVALAKPSRYTVRSARNTIRVELKGAARVPAPPVATKGAPIVAPRPSALSAAPARASAVQPQTPAPVRSIEPGAPVSAAATIIERIKSSRTPGATTITLVGNGRLAAAGVTESKDRPRRLVLDFPNVTSTAPTQTAIDSPLVTRVRVALNSQQPLVTRVVMEIASSASYRVERGGESGRDLAVVFEQARPANTVTLPLADPLATPVEPEPLISLEQAMANVAAITRPEPVGEPVDPMLALKTAALTRPEPPPPAVERERPASTPVRPSPPAPVLEALAPVAAAPPQPQAMAPTVQARAQGAPVTPQPPVLPAPPQGTRSGSGTQPKQYTGDPLSLDLDGVDLRAVLRTFSEVSGLNMVIDPDVQGTVDIKLTDVPWDQALDVILRANQLDYSVDGTIVRVSKIATLEAENRARQSASQAASERQAQAGLSFETFPLSYAKAADMAPLLRGSLRMSRFGQVQVDVRTNTLIIADLPDQFAAIRNLLTTLDRPEPQVEIEARVITTTRDFARAIGVQWGLNGRMTPEIGNTTNLAFPNSGVLIGETGSIGRAGRPQLAIGLALGAVNGAFNLDVALSALERSGKGRVLSTPRVTTQNNVEAEIMQGVQIPLVTPATPNSPETVHLQGRGADAQGDAADHRREHGHHADHGREREPRRAPRKQRPDRHATREHARPGQ